MSKTANLDVVKFPYPREVTGVSHKMAKIGYARVSSFPYPLEATGASYAASPDPS